MSQPFDGATVASLDAPSVSQSIRLAVVSDIHLCEDEDSYKKVFRPTTVFRRTVEDINARGVDVTLSVGDITLKGRTEEYELVDDALSELRSPFLSIPGNHDVRNTFNSHPGISIEEFAERYSPGEFPFSVDVGGQEVIGLDSSSAREVRDSHDGYVDDSQVDWLDERLDSADEPVVTVHHNLPDAMAQFDDYSQIVDPSLNRPPVLRDPEPLVEVLSAHRVPLVLSGHLHVPMFAETDGVRELLVPSTCSFPQAYYVLEIGPDGTEVTHVPVTTTDEATTAYTDRAALKPKAAALCEMASIRLSTLPLCDESTAE